MRWPLRRKPAGRRDRNQVPATGGIVKGGMARVGEAQDCGGTPPRRPDRTRIQLLEHELLGIDPPAGSAAAALIGYGELGQRLRDAMAVPVDRERCPHEDMVETPVMGSTRVPGVCVGCGAHRVQGEDGGWVFP